MLHGSLCAPSSSARAALQCVRLVAQLLRLVNVVQAQPLQLLEAAMLICEGTGLTAAASQIALAAMQAVDAALPPAEAAAGAEAWDAPRELRRSRLAGNLFAYCLQADRFEVSCGRQRPCSLVVGEVAAAPGHSGTASTLAAAHVLRCSSLQSDGFEGTASVTSPQPRLAWLFTPVRAAGVSTPPACTWPASIPNWLQEAYAALVANPAPQARVDLLGALVHRLCAARAVRTLVRLPYAGRVKLMRAHG